jgi:hypothetical protein
MEQTPILALPYKYEGLKYVSLPARADDGFPQVFLMDLAGTVYRLLVGVNFADPSLVLSPQYAGTFFDLPDPNLGLYLTLRVEREDQPVPNRLLGASRILLDVPLAIGPLRVRFSRMKIAQANLAGPGQFGSELIGEVAVANG